MDIIANVPDSVHERLSDDEHREFVWSEARVRSFLESNLGLSTDRKIPGRIVVGHNEALQFWKELIGTEDLTVPFEVVHVDSHADLGLGYNSWIYILDELLSYPVRERPQHNTYVDCFDRSRQESIGDYLLFAIAYRWISKLTYCANPNGSKNDYLWDILKDYEEEMIWDDPVENAIQMLHNPDMDFPDYSDDEDVKTEYIRNSIKEPEVPFTIIPTIEAVCYKGNFDYVVMAQSPNYTPACADFIMDIVREYITEI